MGLLLLAIFIIVVFEMEIEEALILLFILWIFSD